MTNNQKWRDSVGTEDKFEYGESISKGKQSL
jgi:hypothetical protein